MITIPWYPAAANHNIPPGPADPPINPRIIVAHTMVGTIEVAERHFRDGSGVEAHFGIARDGRVWQWRDTSVQADAQAGGNDYCISVETEDDGDPSLPWTAQQLRQLDLLFRWLSRTHNIPMRLVSSTSERGIGYHRQFAVWNPNKHSCPGDVRLRQLLDVVIPGLQRQPEEDLAIVDDQTKQYLDSQFTAIRDRDDRLALWIAGRANAAYSPQAIASRLGMDTIDFETPASGAVVRGIADAVKAMPGVDPAAFADLLAGRLEITGISTDPGGTVTVTFGPRVA